MCKVIAVAMQKGGCAKTSVSLNLGIGLARAGKKVLLIDNDPQGNLTASLGYEEPDDMSDTLASVMMKIINEEPIEPGYGILHHQEGIDLIPGNIELSGLEVLLANVMSRENILKEYIDQIKDQYGYIIIDCMPSLGMTKTIYKDAAGTIEGNCDTMLFLGGKESSTLKEISEILGKETIDLYNTSDTRGSNRSYGLNYQKTGKELMSKDELAVMDGNKCILQLRGVRPFLSDKFDITKHKRYKELSDYDKKNEFDIQKYLEHKLILKKDMVFEMYECNVSEAEVAAIAAEDEIDE
ncbi:AAA family ATPase [Coprococcus catus]